MKAYKDYESVVFDSDGNPLLVDSSESSAESIRDDRELAVLLLQEATEVFLNGEPDVARLLLRNLVNGTMGFEGLAAKLDKSSKSLHRMLSAKGNPTMDNLAAIISTLRQYLEIERLQVVSGSAESYEEGESVELEAAPQQEQFQPA